MRPVSSRGVCPHHAPRGGHPSPFLSVCAGRSWTSPCVLRVIGAIDGIVEFERHLAVGRLADDVGVADMACDLSSEMRQAPTGFPAFQVRRQPWGVDLRRKPTHGIDPVDARGCEIDAPIEEHQHLVKGSVVTDLFGRMGAVPDELRQL